MRADEALRHLARVRSEKGKLSDHYAIAVRRFVDACVDPATGAVAVHLVCPACSSQNEQMGLPLRYVVLGCSSCGDSGLACPSCTGAIWVRKGHAGYTETDLLDSRPATLLPCPTCATWDPSMGKDGGYVRDSLRVAHAIEALFISERMTLP